ncbi:hypothetical protein [Pedobacter caeni]|uniref:MetA-pathway of phenol degradation n=1 Tax=Pedobacter caeni TaxID=288992 RepID=A0A1M4UMY6_9SPHI|nr:hypothetical protein [Pedobacter caeni]SHE58089.1 hypothetical protein SAMN04488522_101625 [Pedobacter caeni]
MNSLKNVGVAVAMLLLSVPTLQAQDSTALNQSEKIKKYKPFDANLQLRSLYIWRGFKVSDAPISNVDLHYKSKDGSFQTGFWGGASLNGNYKEFDYYVSYTKKGFTISVWDINNFSDFPNANLFNYKKGTTSHFIDAGIAYKFDFKLPLTLSWNTIVAGRDTYVKNNGKLGNAYSNYVQLDQVLWQDEENSNLHVFAGGGFAFGREQNFYGNRPNVVNAGLTYNKDLLLFKYRLPVSATAMFNPERKIGTLQLVASIF